LKPNEKKAKEQFSRYVRLRDCIKTTGSTDYGKCITCGEIVPFENSHCGHFISGRGNSLFFEETNSHLQCPSCNTSLGGNPEVYRMKMIKKYGLKEVERLESLRHVPVKIREGEFEGKFNFYKSKFNDMISNN